MTGWDRSCRMLPFILLLLFTSAESVVIKRSFTVEKPLADATFVVFPALLSDGYTRPLSEACQWRTIGSWKLVNLGKTKQGQQQFDVTLELNRVPPGCAGKVSICASPPELFTKTPLFDRKAMVCKPTRVTTVPNSKAIETIEVDMFTWFMTSEHYMWMYRGRIAHIAAPLFPTAYTLPIYVAVYTGHDHDRSVLAGCHFQSPGKAWKPLTVAAHRSSYHSRFGRFLVKVAATPDNSGMYTVSCRVSNLYTPDITHKRNGPKFYRSVPLVQKSFSITFFKGLMLEVIGGSTSQIVFSPTQTSGTFGVRVFSASSVETFEFKRSDDKGHQQEILIEQGETVHLITRYQVGMPWINQKTAGTYAMSATNQDGESSSQTVEVIKAQALSVLVSPSQLVIGEGAVASFDCLVLGHPVRTVWWTCDTSALVPWKSDVNITKLGDGEGLRLTFLSPRLEDSGRYICSASNRFQKVKDIVTLAVFPPGSPYIDPNYQSPEEISDKAVFDGDKVLNITQDELLEEWESHINDENDGSGGGGTSVMTVVLTAVFAVALLGTGSIFVVILVMRFCRNTGNAKVVRNPRRAGQEKGPLRQESRLELIPNTMRSDSESDLLKAWLDSEDDGLTPKDQPEELDYDHDATMDMGVLGPEKDNNLPQPREFEKQGRGKGDQDGGKKKKSSKTKGRETEGPTEAAQGQESVQGADNLELELNSEKQPVLAGGKGAMKEGRKQKKNKRKKE